MAGARCASPIRSIAKASDGGGTTSAAASDWKAVQVADFFQIILGFLVLGFVAGAIAGITYRQIAPFLQNFPFLLSSDWFIAES
jgi:hypothetical protein